MLRIFSDPAIIKAFFQYRHKVPYKLRQKSQFHISSICPVLNGTEITFIITFLERNSGTRHYVKSVRIRSYSGLYFPVFGLNTKRDGVSLRIQSECEKMRTRITPNTDTFYVMRTR